MSKYSNTHTHIKTLTKLCFINSLPKQKYIDISFTESIAANCSYKTTLRFKNSTI